MAGKFENFLRWCERRHAVFGPDVYSDYSHAYVWQANQIAHAMLGLLGTLFVIVLLSPFGHRPLLAGAFTLFAYVIKEAIDYLIATRLTEGVFPPNRREILSDGAADTLFVAVGVSLAVFLQTFPPGSPGGTGVFALALVTAVGLFVLVRALALPSKRRFDESGLRTLVRLPTFPANFTQANGHELVSRWIDAVRNSRGAVRHLVITGPPKSGRTTLGLAIGAEIVHALKRPVRYLSASHMIETIQAASTAAPQSPWNGVDALIVDEISMFTSSAAGTLDLLIGPPAGTQRPPTVPALPSHVVWILSDPGMTSGFAQALLARFGGTVEVVELAGTLTRKNRT